MINEKYEFAWISFMNKGINSLYKGAQWFCVLIMADLRALPYCHNGNRGKLDPLQLSMHEITDDDRSLKQFIIIPREL